MNLFDLHSLLMDLIIEDPVKSTDSWIYIVAGVALAAAAVALVLVLKKKKKTDSK